MMITAKVKCNLIYTQGDVVRLEFVADYDDGRNKEWAIYTPALNLSMTVRGEVAERFEAGGKYTLTFSPTVDTS